MVSRRLWSTVLLALGAVLGAAPALAQPSTTPITGAGDLAASDFTIKLQQPDGNGGWEYLSSVDEGLFFNQARCQCADDDNAAVNILVQMESASRAKLAQILTKTGAAGYAKLYVGTNCAQLNATNTGPNCPDKPFLLGSITTLAPLSSTGSWPVKATVGELFAGAACSTQAPTNIWLWLSTTGASYPDSSLNGSSAPNKPIKLNGTPPPAPNNVVVEGGNEALTVSWGASSTTDKPVNTLAGYIVFCARAEDLKVFSPSFYKSDQYQTASILCPGANILPIASSNPGSLKGDTTAIEVAPPAAFKALNPDYTCTGLVSPSSTSARLRILQNQIPYTVGVAAVDTSGNISPITSAFVQRPIATLDFYETYRDDGGQSLGGYCTLGGGTGRSGWLLCLAGAGLLGLSLIRRHRRRRSSGMRGLLTLLFVLLSAGSAQAQPAISHEDLSSTFEEPRHAYATPKKFAFELRFGPFRPDVDSEFSSGATPYKDTFGGKRHLMSQFELDWQLFQSFGSLALGGSIGYYNQSAKAVVVDPTGKPTLDKDGVPIRSGDDTSLRLIPIAGLVVYRFDAPALRWGVPLVPYVKLGLNYTLWRITDGNSSVPSYLGGRGSGGTWGWQMAGGLALMLDFIDPTAARSLDLETGVNHTYLFFEWNKVAANGLGQSDKLHVGDSRWVLGLMFEL